MSDMQVQAELTLKDNMTKPAAKGLEEVAKSADKLQQSGKQRGADGRFLKQMATDGSAAARSMDAVGRETQQLQQQIKGAERSGSALRRTLSGVRDAGRDAAKHMAQMGKGLAAAKHNATAFGGGVMAAGYVAKTAMEKPMDYEAKLASMANVAYADKDATGRIAGMKTLDASIINAVRTGGGSRDSAADALNTLLAAGTDESTAKQLLPVIQKAATASGADGKELASILTKGISQKQFTAAEAQAAIDKAIKAGEAGQFELKDMARWLPQIISAGKGMKGMEGYEAHLANLQGIANVTGSNDQAGNAYFNLLGKITSTDATANFKKMKINLPKELSKAAQQGVDPVTAFTQLVESKVVAKDKNFTALQKKIATTSDKDEKRLLMEQAAEILQGTAVGKILQDREALLGLVGVMSQKDTIADVREQLKNAEGATQRSFDVVSSTTNYKAEQASNEKDIALSATLDSIKNPLDATLDSVARFAQENPILATATAGTATAGGMATAGGTAWGGMKLLQGAKPAADAGTAIASAGGGLAGTAAKVASKAALPLAMGGAAYEIYSTENDATTSREQKNIANMQTYGGFGGMLAGAAMGGAAGSVVPILGNGIGAILGGLVGYFAGGQAGKGVGEMAWGGESTPETAPQLPDANIQQDITLTVELDGQKVAEILERRQTRESLRQ